MGKKKMKFSDEGIFRPSIISEVNRQTGMNMEEFFRLHASFMQAKALEGLAPRTLKEHVTNIDYFKKYLSSDCQSIEDRHADIDVFRGYISYMVLEKQYKPCTVNIRLRTLKTYIKWLHAEGYMEKDLSTKLKLVKVPEDTIKPLTEAEVKKMLKAPDKTTYSGYRDFTLMVLILDCGIRIGEALQLRIGDIDLKYGLVNIRAEVSKTRSFRQVPISNKTCKLIKELINVAKESESDYVFQSTYGGSIKKDNTELNFRRYAKRAGLEGRFSPYNFRHTFATNAVKSGMDIFTLQKIMGHSTLLTTRKYVQLNNEDLKRNHEKMSFVSKYLK